MNKGLWEKRYYKKRKKKKEESMIMHGPALHLPRQVEGKNRNSTWHCPYIKCTLWHWTSPTFFHPFQNHTLCIRKHLLLETEQGRDGATDLLFASYSWLSAWSCPIKQISGSDLWPGASVLMRTSGISHSTEMNTPISQEKSRMCLLCTALCWGNWGAVPFSEMKLWKVPGMNVRQNSYSMRLSTEGQGHVKSTWGLSVYFP